MASIIVYLISPPLLNRSKKQSFALCQAVLCAMTKTSNNRRPIRNVLGKATLGESDTCIPAYKSSLIFYATDSITIHYAVVL